MFCHGAPEEGPCWSSDSPRRVRTVARTDLNPDEGLADGPDSDPPDHDRGSEQLPFRRPASYDPSRQQGFME
jgi:hypothetical protein